jgi:hypothetical protein
MRYFLRILAMLIVTVFVAGIEVPQAEAGLAEQLRGKTVRYHDGGVSTHGADGSYAYRGPGVPGTHTGTYTIRGNTIIKRFHRGGGMRHDTILPGNRLRDDSGRIYTFTVQ